MCIRICVCVRIFTRCGRCGADCSIGANLLGSADGTCVCMHICVSVYIFARCGWCGAVVSIGANLLGSADGWMDLYAYECVSVCACV